jgi:hypothetical protein
MYHSTTKRILASECDKQPVDQSYFLSIRLQAAAIRCYAAGRPLDHRHAHSHPSLKRPTTTNFMSPKLIFFPGAPRLLSV